MKKVLAMVGGFAVTLGTFAGGAFVTFMVLKTEPTRALAADDDTVEVWSSEPRTVDVASQEFERIASAIEVEETERDSVGIAADEAVLVGGDRSGAIDTMATASVEPPDEPANFERAALEETQADLMVAHVDWCYDHYRSYDADTNSYQPYSGGRRECVSPYLEELEAMASGGAPVASYTDPRSSEFAVIEDRPAIVDTDNQGGLMLQVADRAGMASTVTGQAGGLSDAHIRDCFDRYRSYEPATNSYQPYGGGPRRQCE